jgi:hypothetical protein
LQRLLLLLAVALASPAALSGAAALAGEYRIGPMAGWTRRTDPAPPSSSARNRRKATC